MEYCILVWNTYVQSPYYGVRPVFESIVDQHLLGILEPSVDLKPFGCRRERSTTRALVAMTHIWQTELHQGRVVRGVVLALFVDLRKAFDSVNHNILLHKLLDRKVPHCVIKWFFSLTRSKITTCFASVVVFEWCYAAGFLAWFAYFPGFD